MRARPRSTGEAAGLEEQARAEREAAQARRERDAAEHGREAAARDLADALRQRDQARQEQARLPELERELARQFADKRAELEVLKKQVGEQIDRWLTEPPV